MCKNKWYFFLLLFLGLDAAGQAIHYFIGGDSARSSSLRDFLVAAQFIFGLTIAFYGWKKFRLMSDLKSQGGDYGGRI